MYKNVVASIITFTLLFSPTPSYAEDIASGLSQFVYGLLYMNIGSTSCKEIIEKDGGKEGMIGQMTSLVNTANSMAGKETIDMDVVKEYFEDLYDNCKENPDQMFAQALAQVARPLFTSKRRQDKSPEMEVQRRNSQHNSGDDWYSADDIASSNGSSQERSNSPLMIG